MKKGLFALFIGMGLMCCAAVHAENPGGLTDQEMKIIAEAMNRCIQLPETERARCGKNMTPAERAVAEKLRAAYEANKKAEQNRPPDYHGALGDWKPLTANAVTLMLREQYGAKGIKFRYPMQPMESTYSSGGPKGGVVTPCWFVSIEFQYNVEGYGWVNEWYKAAVNFRDGKVINVQLDIGS